MSRELSVARIITELQDQVEHHRRQEVFHAEQEVFHREERARHAADLQVALERLALFETAADAAGELVARALDKRQREKEKEKVVDESIPPGKNNLSKLVDRIVFAKDMEETFGATDVTALVQERYGARLKRRIEVRSVAAKLRRMARSRQIHRVREGRSFHESLYRKGPGGGHTR